MLIDGWKYYNHAAIPTNPPHEDPCMSPVESGDIWKIDGGRPLLARWTTEFDCDVATDWWYVIKDTPFDIASLKAKRRYEINKGQKFFSVEEIDPKQYGDVLFKVQEAAYSVYPKKYRPTTDKAAFEKKIDAWCVSSVFGAFFRETGGLVGYAVLDQNGDRCVDFSILKTVPEYEKYSLNAALVYEILQKYDEFLKNGGYICDGSRNINHETGFQDYLEKYFGFRKAYCKLHSAYLPKVKRLVNVLYVFRRFIGLFDFIRIVHFLNSVLKMEEICRRERDI